jgi:hypothetical protein
MSSFISTLSLFIFILSNGYLTLPINNEQFFNSTFSSLNNLTTEQTSTLQFVSDNETTVFPNINKKHLSDGHIGFEISTSMDNLSEENATQISSTFDYFFTTESTITTEQYFNDKHDYDQSLSSSSEPTIQTTEQSYSNKHDYDDLLFTTVEPTTQITGLERRGPTNELESETEAETDKREIEIELTTNDLFSFPSTSSAVAPALYTSEVSISTSTEKYTGLLTYENEQEQPTKYVKTLKKTTQKSKLIPTINSNVQSEEEDSKEPTAPIAVFDQEALNKIPYVPNDFLILDENNTLVVTDLPDKLSTSTIQNTEEQKPLNQGKESLHSEEKESDN